MNDLKFNNLLKIKLNVEGDSGDKYNIPFNSRMLFYDKIPATINTDGLLLSDTINMTSGQSSSSRWQQPGSSQENECPNDNISISDIEVLKKNLNQSVNRVNDKNRPGLTTNDHYINFVKDEEDLKKKFHMFKPLHIGYYDGVYRNDERSEKHLTFIGVKK